MRSASPDSSSLPEDEAGSGGPSGEAYATGVACGVSSRDLATPSERDAENHDERKPMNTDPSKSGAVNAEPLKGDPAGQDPTGRVPAADVKLQLQLAIFEASKDSKGKSLAEILEKLRSAFAARGVAEPPATWLESVASSAFYGEPYLIDFPTAIAADSAVPAPNQEVRNRLAGRRELRAEKLPPGIFPSRDDWDVPIIESPEAVNPAVISRRATRIAAGLVFVGVVVAAIVLVIQSARTSNWRRTTLRAKPRGGEVG